MGCYVVCKCNTCELTLRHYFQAPVSANNVNRQNQTNNNKTQRQHTGD